MITYYRDRVDLLRRGLQHASLCMEVGVATGGFSELIMEICDPWRLVLVDTVIQERVPRVFAKDIAMGQVHIHQGLSPHALQNLKHDAFSWVYIDADHSEEAVYKDLCAASLLVHENGYLAGHDICTSGNEDKVARHYPGVLVAVTRFCKEHNWSICGLTEVHPQHGRIDHATPNVQSYVLVRNR